jgi:hypothetical protein
MQSSVTYSGRRRIVAAGNHLTANSHGRPPSPFFLPPGDDPARDQATRLFNRRHRRL